MQSSEERKAYQRAAWQRYAAKPENVAKIKKRDRARDKDPARNRRRHERTATLHRDRLQVYRRTQDRRARALKQGVPFALPSTAEPPIPLACGLCGLPFGMHTRVLKPDLDRVVPALGYVPGNVQWLHKICNSRKGSLTLAAAKALPQSQWRVQLLAYLRRCSH